jgi:hypothetical protein
MPSPGVAGELAVRCGAVVRRIESRHSRGLLRLREAWSQRDLAERSGVAHAADAGELVAWLANDVLLHERGPDRVRTALYARCRELSLEPPTPSASSVWFSRPWPAMSNESLGRYMGAWRRTRSQHWTGC